MYLNLISSPTITLLCPLQTITFQKFSLNNKLWYPLPIWTLWYPLPKTCMYPFVSAYDNYLNILSKQLPVSILPTFNICILSKIHVVQFSITITLWHPLSTIILLYPLPIRTIWYLLQTIICQKFSPNNHPLVSFPISTCTIKYPLLTITSWFSLVLPPNSYPVVSPANNYHLLSTPNNYHLVSFPTYYLLVSNPNN